VPARRRNVRSFVVHAWWLAVPAVAAAVGWPMTRGARPAAAPETAPAAVSSGWREVSAAAGAPTVTPRGPLDPSAARAPAVLGRTLAATPTRRASPTTARPASRRNVEMPRSDVVGARAAGARRPRGAGAPESSPAHQGPGAPQ
jgi:hypothetical protein